MTDSSASPSVEDLRYEGPDGEPVDAYLVTPSPTGNGTPAAGLVMWHWLDTEAPDGNRTEFLEEARELAGLGFVALLPQGRFPWAIDPTGSEADTREIRAEVGRLRRGLDLLTARIDVDPSRVGIVGHDFGAMLGVLAAAEDARVRALALIAPAPRWGDWFLPFWPIAEDRIDYLRAMRPLDPVEQIGAVAPRPIVLQMGRRDFFVPLMGGLELRRAAGERAELEAYDAEHDLRTPEAAADRRAFLLRTLGAGV